MRLTLSMLAVALGLCACSNDESVTLHKPGIYKGPADPLIEMQRSAQQQETLIARFKQVQTDR